MPLVSYMASQFPISSLQSNLDIYTIIVNSFCSDREQYRFYYSGKVRSALNKRPIHLTFHELSKRKNALWLRRMTLLAFLLDHIFQALNLKTIHIKRNGWCMYFWGASSAWRTEICQNCWTSDQTFVSRVWYWSTSFIMAISKQHGYTASLANTAHQAVIWIIEIHVLETFWYFWAPYTRRLSLWKSEDLKTHSSKKTIRHEKTNLNYKWLIHYEEKGTRWA